MGAGLAEGSESRDLLWGFLVRQPWGPQALCLYGTQTFPQGPLPSVFPIPVNLLSLPLPLPHPYCPQGGLVV